MATATTESEMLNTVEAARFLGVKLGTLNTWRSTKRYPIRYHKIGKKVCYKRTDLEKWRDSCAHDITPAC